ncbi:MAG: S-layer protein [Firmicutes bacterium]|nr:S-layer protein [Bacillota bacterium]
MKKSLVVMLTLIFILGIAGTAFAANPFSDVPAGHWAYGAVSKLYAAGIIDGMGDGTFQGNKTLTRYEMATFVARAMTKEEKVNAEQKALIEKLASEFKGELEGLGVRVQKLEDNANKIIFSGNARLRYDGQPKKPAGSSAIAAAKNINFDLVAQYNIGDDWAAVVESEWLRKIDNPNTSSDSSTMMATQHEQQYVTSGKHFLVGRHSYEAGYGLTFYSKVQGLQYTIGDDKANLVLNWGHTSDTAIADSADFKAAELVVSPTGNTNIRADFQRIQIINEGYDKYYGIGFDTKLGDLTLTAAASKSEVTTTTEKKTASFAQIQYLNADKAVAHSSDFFVAYTKIPNDVVCDRDDADETYSSNFKGAKVGFHYVPMKNTLVTVWYMNGKVIDADSTYNVAANDKVSYVRAQAQFFF